MPTTGPAAVGTGPRDATGETTGPSDVTGVTGTGPSGVTGAERATTQAAGI